jgi:hypothetical protein
MIVTAVYNNEPSAKIYKMSLDLILREHVIRIHIRNLKFAFRYELTNSVELSAAREATSCAAIR